MVSRRSLLRSAASGSAVLAMPSVAVIDQRSTGDFSRLRSTLEGSVLLPVDGGFEQARRVASFNPHTDKNPALIVRCTSAADVARSVDFARYNDLEIAVKSGGHDVLGDSACEGGMMIDTGMMTGLQVSTSDRTVCVGSGVRSAQLDGTLQSHNLSAALGCNPMVGVAGLTLGGGLGWLLGKHGASCDNLRSVEVVTADGRQLKADNTENEDLFWGLKGGGGNFGIATLFEYAVHPIDQVVGGLVVISGDRLAEFMHFYADFMAKAPDELTVEITITTASEPLVVAMVCYAGDDKKAETVLKPLRTFGPLADTIGRFRYPRFTNPPPEVLRQFERPPGETRGDAQGPYNSYWKGASLSDWSDQAVTALVAARDEAMGDWSIGLGHYMHGAICRVNEAATPLIRREGSYSYFFNTGWRGSSESGAHMAWVDDSIANLAKYSHAAYINYLSSNAEVEVAAAYGANYGRLQSLKRRFDPDNLFHLNRNIVPAKMS